MNYSLEVVLLSLLMFVGTFLLGWIPTKINASTKVMNLISIFGAGMLVGAAIIVVIPEAVKVIIEATYDPASGEEEVVPESVAFNMGTAIVIGFTIMLIIDESFKILQQNVALESADAHERFGATALKEFGNEKANLLNDSQSPNSSDEERQRQLRASGGAGTSTTMQLETQNQALGNASGSKNVLITTIGLAIHSLADGAALGASLYLESFGESQGLGMIIFIAIMLHKAPASMGFGTFLQHQGCKGMDHAKHLLAFTASSPLMNMIIFFGLMISQSKSTELAQLQFWVGILMLISAGSFLYVATIHILPEVYALGDDNHGKSPAEQILKYQESHYSKTIELGVLLTGLYLPMALQFVPDE